jgi:hypothetical protein
MPIYRGPGGSGDAVNDATSEVLLAIQAKDAAIVAQLAAEASAALAAESVEGIVGPQGPAGQGVPVGGTVGQALTKINSTNYNTQWTTVLLPADIGSTVQGYDVDTAKTDVAQSFSAAQRGAISTLTDGATITPDFALANNFTVTLGGNRTLANPTNLTAGQSGSIFIVQDGTGSRTLAYGNQYDFIGGTAPTLSTAASSVDRIDYVVRTTGSIHCVFTANYS